MLFAILTKKSSIIFHNINIVRKIRMHACFTWMGPPGSQTEEDVCQVMEKDNDLSKKKLKFWSILKVLSISSVCKYYPLQDQGSELTWNSIMIQLFSNSKSWTCFTCISHSVTHMKDKNNNKHSKLTNEIRWSYNNMEKTVTQSIAKPIVKFIHSSNKCRREWIWWNSRQVT